MFEFLTKFTIGEVFKSNSPETVKEEIPAESMELPQEAPPVVSQEEPEIESDPFPQPPSDPQPRSDPYPASELPTTPEPFAIPRKPIVQSDEPSFPINSILGKKKLYDRIEMEGRGNWAAFWIQDRVLYRYHCVDQESCFKIAEQHDKEGAVFVTYQGAVAYKFFQGEIKGFDLAKYNASKYLSENHNRAMERIVQTMFDGGVIDEGSGITIGKKGSPERTSIEPKAEKAGPFAGLDKHPSYSEQPFNLMVGKRFVQYLVEQIGVPDPKIEPTDIKNVVRMHWYRGQTSVVEIVCNLRSCTFEGSSFNNEMVEGFLFDGTVGPFILNQLKAFAKQ